MQHTSSTDEERRRYEQRRTLDAIAQRLEEQEFRRYGTHLFSVPHVHEQQLDFVDVVDDWPAA